MISKLLIGEVYPWISVALLLVPGVIISSHFVVVLLLRVQKPFYCTIPSDWARATDDWLSDWMALIIRVANDAICFPSKCNEILLSSLSPADWCASCCHISSWCLACYYLYYFTEHLWWRTYKWRAHHYSSTAGIIMKRSKMTHIKFTNELVCDTHCLRHCVIVAVIKLMSSDFLLNFIL